MGLFSLFRDFDIVAGLYLAGFKNLYEYALARHNAVACGLAYRAVVMALLADLRDLAQCRAYTQLCADRQRVHRHAFNKDILGKRTVLELKAEFFLKLCNTVDRQQTHLSVPFATMSVSFDSPILNQISLWYLVLLCTTFFADTDA